MTKCCSWCLVGVATLNLLMQLPSAHGENVQELKARLESAKTLSALDVPDLRPWHLKLAVQLFDEKGKQTDQGTIEEWWSAPGTDRREYKISAYSATEIRNSGKLYRTKGTASPPYFLELLRQQSIHPTPEENDIIDSTPELRKHSFGKIALDCIMLSQPIKQIPTLPLGLFPTYCFDPGQDVLVASFEFGNQTIVRNGLGLFQGKKVATKLSVLSEKAIVASSQLVALASGPMPAAEFDPSIEEAEQSLATEKVGSGVVAGNLVARPDPIYPQSAKDRHISGTVILRAIIGTDGHIHSLKLVSAPDTDLAISAIAAVRKWTYKPYLLLGKPTDVETTINVNYTFQ